MAKFALLSRLETIQLFEEDLLATQESPFCAEDLSEIIELSFTLSNKPRKSRDIVTENHFHRYLPQVLEELGYKGVTSYDVVDRAAYLGIIVPDTTPGRIPNKWMLAPSDRYAYK